MDWGLITAVVAAVFGFIGIVTGMTLAKVTTGGEKKVSPKPLEDITPKVEALTKRIEETLSDLKEKGERLNQQLLSSVEREVEELLLSFEELKREIEKVGLTESSRKALESALEVLKNFKLSHPNFDNSLLMQVKDNLLIIRNDLQSLILSKEEKTSLNNLKDIFSSIDSAINLAREINVTLLKDELSILTDCLKKEEMDTILKDIDRQTLAAKELVLLLNDLKERIKKGLKGVKNESFIC